MTMARPFQPSAIASWLKVLKDDRRAIFTPPPMRSVPLTICTVVNPPRRKLL